MGSTGVAVRARESGLLSPARISITCAGAGFLRLWSRNRETSRPIITPATRQPTAIPTTAPVLSPSPEVGAGDEVLVI